MKKPICVKCGKVGDDGYCWQCQRCWDCMENKCIPYKEVKMKKKIDYKKSCEELLVLATKQRKLNEESLKGWQNAIDGWKNCITIGLVLIILGYLSGILVGFALGGII